MTALKYTACFAFAFALSACNDQPSDTVPVGDEPVVEEIQTDTTDMPDTGETNELQRPDRTDAAFASNGFRSVYTELDLEDCDMVEGSAESTDRIYQCDGYQDMEIFVHDSDGRFTVAAGQSPDFFVQNQPLNIPGTQIEWRLKEEEPHAIIYSLMMQYPEDTEPPEGVRRDKERLVVASLPANGQSGCAQAVVMDVSNQGHKARNYADMLNGQSGCPNDPAVITGD